MTILLPQEYKILKEYAESLPIGSSPLGSPFAGLVLNLRVATTAHKDSVDKITCGVIPFGKYKGGEPCLYEAKLAFSLPSGFILFFPSDQFVHYNLHFQGKRGSIVLQSDRHFDEWIQDRNGWKELIQH